MKVAYLTTYYNGAIDGRFGRFHDWVHTLRDMDDPPFEFEVISLTASNPDDILTSKPHAILGEATELWDSPKNKIEFSLNVPRAIRDLRRIDFDVLHVLTLDMIAYPIALASSRRSPVIGPDVQGYVPGREGERWDAHTLSGLKYRARFHLRRVLPSMADDPTYIALSEYHADNVKELVGEEIVKQIPPGVNTIFNSGIDMSNEKEPGQPTEFLYAGDLSSYKGYYLFLDALSRLPDDISFQATVVGSGDPDHERIANLGLTNKVDVKGFVTREDLPRYYRGADFYVMPSVDESGPNTIVESLACGTPVIATDKPGINEYAPDDASIYFNRSPSSIGEAMVEAHENRRRYRDAALAHANQFRAHRTVNELDGIYRDHLKRVS